HRGAGGAGPRAPSLRAPRGPGARGRRRERGLPRLGAKGVDAVRGSGAAGGLGLANALEWAASALAEHASARRPANGAPARLLEALGPRDGAVVLAWLLAHEPADGEELAAAWAEDEGAGVAAVRSLAAEELPKLAQKILRRLLHRLRSSG